MLITELLPAGAEQVVFELATRLPRERWRVRVCSLRSPGGDDGEVARALQRAGVEVVPLRFQGKLDGAGALRLLLELRAFRPHVLHAHLFHANLAARLLGRLGAQRVVSTVHIVERRELPGRELLERLTAFRDHATVCVSEAVARHAQVQLGARPERLQVIPNGIDLSRFSVAADPAAARAAARAALGLPGQATLVGGVGRLRAQKGFPDLIDAFGRLAPEHVDLHLVLAGGGEEEQALRRQVEAAGLRERTHFLGHRDDVPQVLRALDLFVMPSHWEGFGLALTEALACGLPAVATRVDSLPDVLGEAGVLVPARDPARLAEAIDRLLRDPAERARLAALGPEQAARFSVEQMVEAYERLYLRVLLS